MQSHIQGLLRCTGIERAPWFVPAEPRCFPAVKLCFPAVQLYIPAVPRFRHVDAGVLKVSRLITVTPDGFKHFKTIGARPGFSRLAAVPTGVAPATLRCHHGCCRRDHGFPRFGEPGQTGIKTGNV